MSLNRFGRKSTGRGNWLAKAPRRRGTLNRRFGQCETLEPRQMLSADGFGFGPSLALTGPDPIEDIKGPITPPANSGLLPVEQTFLLASKPDSNFTLYLDFNGHITQDPGWDGVLTETRPRFGLPFATPPYDTSGDTDVFTDQELLTIQEAYMRVAEDFAPFDLNVTTIEPSVDDLINRGGDDQRWGMRIAIGGSAFDWYLPEDGSLGGAGGVALLNSFMNPIDTPAYAFEESGYGNADNLALVISHEAGHTLGLVHDGNFIPPVIEDPEEPPTEPEVNEYYAGHENNLWGPIMGAPYGVQVSQWSQGEYFLARNEGVAIGDPLQDDLAQITSNGFGYREDDHADRAIPLNPEDPSEIPTPFDLDYEADLARGEGLIETRTDFDTFSFSTEGGTIEINATPNSFGANLDIRVQLRDSEGQLLATGAPDDNLSASILFENAPAGEYFVGITGDAFRANAQPFDTQTKGYTDYGSLGRYTVLVNADLGAPPDEFELNETIATATQVPLGDFFSSALSLHVEGDQDHFAWQSASDGQLTVTADFLNSEGNAELFVFDEQENIVARSIGTGDGETVSLSVEAGEVFYVLVNAFGNDTQESYSLLIDGPGLLPDEFEVNSTAETAAIVDEAVFDAPASIHVSGDIDYYTWQAASDGLFEVEALYAETGPDLQIEVFRDGEVVATSSPTAGGQDVELAVFTGDLLTIRIAVADGTPIGSDITTYQLGIDGTGVLGDPLEPNDFGNPTPITTQSELFNRISIHTLTDRDYFTYTAPINGLLTVDAEFLHAFGDLDVRVTNAATGALIALATSITDNESLTFTVQEGTTYLIETYGYLGDLVPVYALRTTFALPPANPADLNDDNLVNDDDRLFLASQYGSTGPGLRADLNGDEVVNAADYTIWRDAASTPSIGGLIVDHDHDHDHPVFPPYQPVALADQEAPATSLAVSPAVGFSVQFALPGVEEADSPVSLPGPAATVSSLDLLLEVPQRFEIDDEEAAYESLAELETSPAEEAFAELDAAFGLSI